MKNYYFLLAILLLFNWNGQAQFVSDFEECENTGTVGEPWSIMGCGGGQGCTPLCNSGQAHNGNWSGLIPDDGSTDAILDLGNRIFDEWGISFWQYIPSNKEAYWNLQGVVPVGSGEWIVGNVFFNQDNTNPGVGLIDDTAIGAVNFSFPHDQWFKVLMNWDISSGISLATWEMFVDGVEVIPTGTPFTNNTGTVPTSLGGIDFFSISSDNMLYLDDFIYINGFLGTSDFSEIAFTLFPNPTQNILSIKTQEPIENISIYNLLGNLVKEVSGSTTLNVSQLKSGMYLIEVMTSNGKSIQKFIKE